MTSSVAIAEAIIDVDEEITGVPDEETTGVTDEHTGVATSDNRENTGVPNKEDNNMAAIDAAITEVAATLDQELRKIKAEPEDTKDAEVSHPNTTTKTIRRVYNLHKGKNGNRGRDYSHRFGGHSVALVNIALTHLPMKSGMRKYKHKGLQQ